MNSRNRRLQTGAALSASLLLVTACSAGSDASSQRPTVVISMWASGEEETAALKSQVEIAREQNPGIEIELRTSPWADYFTKLTTDMASGNAACVVGMNSSMFAGYATGFRKLSAEDLQSAEVDPADFAEGATDLMSLGGDLYGLPTDISTMVIYTNEDLLGAAGVTAPADGWDYDEFHEAAATATSGDKSGFIVGVSANSWMALPISVSGAQPVTEDGELDLDGDEFVDAATAYAELVTDEQISPEFPSAAETNFAQDQFLAGNAGMVVDGTWNALRYLDNDSGFAAGLAPLPGRDSEEGLGMALGSGYGISESCEQPDAALKVLGSLLSEEAADDIASSGRAYPARTASQPLYLEALPEEHREKIQATFDAAFAHVEGQRVTEDWPKIGAYMLPNLIEVYSGRMTMADLLASAQSQFGG